MNAVAHPQGRGFKRVERSNSHQTPFFHLSFSNCQCLPYYTLHPFEIVRHDSRQRSFSQSGPPHWRTSPRPREHLLCHAIPWPLLLHIRYDRINRLRAARQTSILSRSCHSMDRFRHFVPASGVIVPSALCRTQDDRRGRQGNHTAVPVGDRKSVV